MRTYFTWLPGLLLVVIIAACAQAISHYAGFSVTLAAILLGFVLGNLFRVPKSCLPGIKWSECQALSIAVALLGVQLNVAMLSEVQGLSLLLIAVALVLTFVVTLLLAKWLRLNHTQACLLASGQGICGSAAVMATQQVVKASSAQAGMVVALVNFLGFLGVFVLPGISHQLLTDDPVAAGHLIGNTLQSMGHVVAAGFTADEGVGHIAVLIKMCRILFLIPVLLVLIVIFNKRQTVSTEQIQWFKLMPMFIWVFLLLCLLNSMQWIPDSVTAVLTHISDVLFLVAMVAIGLCIRIKEIWQHGGRLLLLGGMVFTIQIVFSVLAVVMLF